MVFQYKFIHTVTPRKLQSIARYGNCGCVVQQAPTFCEDFTALVSGDIAASQAHAVPAIPLYQRPVRVAAAGRIHCVAPPRRISDTLSSSLLAVTGPAHTTPSIVAYANTSTVKTAGRAQYFRNRPGARRFRYESYHQATWHCAGAPATGRHPGRRPATQQTKFQPACPAT